MSYGCNSTMYKWHEATDQQKETMGGRIRIQDLMLSLPQSYPKLIYYTTNYKSFIYAYVHGIIEGTKTNRNISIVLYFCCFYNEGSII